jgi:hypothetical protein
LSLFSGFGDAIAEKNERDAAQDSLNTRGHVSHADESGASRDTYDARPKRLCFDKSSEHDAVSFQ